MTTNLCINMVRLRVIAAEDADAARILELRKKRREELLEKARENPKLCTSFMVNWYRRRRIITIA